MKTQGILGVILIIAGVILLSYRSFTTTKRENVIDAGPIQVNADVERSHYIPPAVGWAVLAGGVVILVLGAKK